MTFWKRYSNISKTDRKLYSEYLSVFQKVYYRAVVWRFLKELKGGETMVEWEEEEEGEEEEDNPEEEEW